MKSLPPLAHMRTVLRFGMSRDEFFTACDELMENYQLRVGSPSASMNLVSIHVEEGDQLLCYLDDDKLYYVEYQGGVFLDEDEDGNGNDTRLAPAEPRRRFWPPGCLTVLAVSFGLLLHLALAR